MLEPDLELLAVQPGAHDVGRYVLASRSPDGDLAVVYMPTGERLRLKLGALRPGWSAVWGNPRTGERLPAPHETGGEITEFTPPDAEDWLLIIQAPSFTA
jgi:hypothetical protein